MNVASETYDPNEARESQIPALKLLAAMGYEILPQEATERRRGRLSRVVLEDVLSEWLVANNGFVRRGVEHRFNDADAEEAVRKLKPDPTQLRGLIGTNKEIYDALLLGTTIEKTIDGDRKSQSMRYVDWDRPERNVFHASPEFSVERTGSSDTRRCDIVCFVNGIPFAVIECKGADHPVDEGVSQIIGYQGADNIPSLFHFTQLVIAANGRDAKYATVGTPDRFWSIWRDEEIADGEIDALVHANLPAETLDAIYTKPFAEHRSYCESRDAAGRSVTDQDRTLVALLHKDRLLDLIRTFTVFDGGVRKVARYQQFFGIRAAMSRIAQRDGQGRRQGGVIWHTQGSGKSLTMVMLGRALVFSSEVRSPRIVIVTDRKDLDRQIRDTFRSCELVPHQASTGRDLLRRLGEGERLLTAVINKFDTALRSADSADEDQDTFVLVDESHRGQHGSFGAKMRRLLPNACYIGFTGTPLLKAEKSTATRFGGIIHKYTIDNAVKDRAVVPLLYEGRYVAQHVSGGVVDTWFNKLAEGLDKPAQAHLRRKISSIDVLSRTEQAIYAKAVDISEHFRKYWQGTGFKAQLVAPSKAAAIRFKEILDDIGHVSSEVVISRPDDREGNAEVDVESEDVVRRFWDRMMVRYGSEKGYEETIVDAFKGDEEPEILIVVSKLLTGFDAPRNTVLYICRSLKEHNLLQAIARVNRLCEINGEAKQFGYIVDYEGLLGELDQALTAYSSLEGYEEDDLIGAVKDVRDIVGDLPRLHGEVWDIFREVPNKRDREALEVHLGDEPRRHEFFAALRSFGRVLRIALGSEKTLDLFDQEKIDAWRRDWIAFEKLRRQVAVRYGDRADMSKIEPTMRKLLDTHVIAEPAEVIIEMVDITDTDTLRAVLKDEELSDASKADQIASATKRTITERMDEDPALYKALSEMIEEAIAAYRLQRISEREYLDRVMSAADEVREGPSGERTPTSIKGDPDAQAFFGLIGNRPSFEGVAAEARGDFSKEVAELIRSRLIVNFWQNDVAQGELRNALDDYMFDTAPDHGIELTSQEIDELVAELLRVARKRMHR
ncbi:type I restriction endonuclease subunit R [Roseovarius sp.]|uniref:type I restriction endonuclease subunit R n=1 Tax=Roseovarius sp. TaxID=1486281 RepID=UPI003A9737AB